MSLLLYLCAYTESPRLWRWTHYVTRRWLWKHPSYVRHAGTQYVNGRPAFAVGNCCGCGTTLYREIKR